jgi:hypothetical protein
MLVSIKSIMNDRFVQIILLVSVVVLILFYSWSSVNTITPHNFYYLPLLVKLFVFLNLPSIILTGLIFFPIYLTDGDINRSVWLLILYYGTLVSIYFIQWILIGVLLSKVWNVFKQSKG